MLLSLLAYTDPAARLLGSRLWQAIQVFVLVKHHVCNGACLACMRHAATSNTYVPWSTEKRIVVAVPIRPILIEPDFTPSTPATNSPFCQIGSPLSAITIALVLCPSNGTSTSATLPGGTVTVCLYKVAAAVFNVGAAGAIVPSVELHCTCTASTFFPGH